MNEEKKEKFTKRALMAVNDAVFDLFPENPERYDRKVFDRITREGKTKIVDVESIVHTVAKQDLVPEEWEDYFYERMASHNRYRKGVWMYAFKITYDPGTKSLYAQDKHEADVQVIDKNNRAIALVWINNGEYDGDGPSGEYTVRAEGLDSFLYEKGVSAKAVRIARASIDTFYSYETKKGRRYFVQQTQAIKAARKNAPSADLKRHDVNKTSTENDFGITFAIWEDHLVEDYDGIYVSDTMSEEDYKIAMDGYDPGSFAAREVERVYTTSEDSVKNAARKVTIMRDKFQRVIEDYSDAIMTHTLERAGIDPRVGRENVKRMLHEASERYGLDCGWIHFMFRENKSMDETVKTASMYDDLSGVYANGTFSLRLPYSTQSTTIQGFEAEAAVSAIEKECDEKLGFVVTLD